MKKEINHQKLLDKDLLEYNPKEWNFNLPIKNYTVKPQDIIPAISGAIGKISLAAAFAVAWSSLLKIQDNTFVAENVRLEIVIGSLLTMIFCALLNPKAGPPGTLAPLLPLIPLMAVSGVHPLPLSILIGGIGLVLSILRLFSRIVDINGEGTKSGIMLLFGFMGINSSYNSLKEWTHTVKAPVMLIVLLMLGLSFTLF